MVLADLINTRTSCFTSQWVVCSSSLPELSTDRAVGVGMGSREGLFQMFWGLEASFPQPRVEVMLGVVLEL